MPGSNEKTEDKRVVHNPVAPAHIESDVRVDIADAISAASRDSSRPNSPTEDTSLMEYIRACLSRLFPKWKLTEAIHALLSGPILLAHFTSEKRLNSTELHTAKACSAFIMFGVDITGSTGKHDSFAKLSQNISEGVAKLEALDSLVKPFLSLMGTEDSWKSVLPRILVASVLQASESKKKTTTPYSTEVNSD